MTTPNDREAVLYAFAVEPAHDRPTLDRYLRQHPEMTEELIDLFSELRLGEAVGPTAVAPGDDAKGAAAWSEFLGSGSKPAGRVAAANPFDRFRGVDFADLAANLDVPRSLLLALRDCLVVPASVPDRFVSRLAAGLACPAGAMRDHLARPQETPVGLAFKSDVKPAPQKQVTFRELVTNTQMTDGQRDRLLKDCDADGPP